MPNINIYKWHTIHRNTHIYRHMYTQIQIAYLHFALFGSYGINAKNTNFIFGTSHTHGNRYTQAHAHAQMHTDTDTFYILHFLAHQAYMLKILILYLAHHRHTYAQIHRHVHTHRHTCIEALTHRYRYTQTHACVSK